MKRVTFLAVFLLTVFTCVLAQSQRGGQRMTVEERAKRTTEWMKEELNLTTEQIAPVDSINLLFAKAQQIIFQSSDGDREKIRETMEALESEKELSLSEVLTEEQIELYKKKVKEMANNRRQRQ